MNLILFLSFNRSLKDWYNEKTLSRELFYYSNFSKKYNIKISIFSYGDSTDYQYLKNTNLDVITLYRKKKRKSKFINFFYSIFFIIKNRKIFKKFVIMKTNQNYGSWLAILLKIIYPKMILVSRNGYDLYFNKIQDGNFIKSLLAYIICFLSYKLSDHIFVSSSYLKKFVSKKFKINLSKITILSNYINTNQFKPLNLKKRKRKSVLYVGRFEPEKNLFDLIYTFSNTDYSLEFYGHGTLENDLKQYAKINNTKLKIFKPVKNFLLPRVYNKYEFFILNSIYEGNPKVLLEAMSCKLICLGKNVNGINDIIANNCNGILFDQSTSVLNKIKLLKKNSLKFKIGNNSRKYILNNHTFEIIQYKEINIYEKLFKRKN